MKKNTVKMGLLFSLLLVSVSFLNFGEKDATPNNQSLASEILKQLPDEYQHYFKVEERCGEQLVPMNGGLIEQKLYLPGQLNQKQKPDCFWYNGCLMCIQPDGTIVTGPCE